MVLYLGVDRPVSGNSVRTGRDSVGVQSEFSRSIYGVSTERLRSVYGASMDELGSLSRPKIVMSHHLKSLIGVISRQFVNNKNLFQHLNVAFYCLVIHFQRICQFIVIHFASYLPG